MELETTGRIGRPEDGKSGSLGRIAQAVGERWPSLRFLSLAFYSAWILLAVTSSEAVSFLDGQTAGSLQGTLYLSSGIALFVCLFCAGAFADRVQRVIERPPFVVAMGFLASLCTFVLMGGMGTAVGSAVFVVCGIGTGVGTAFVCLRAGFVTSLLNGVRAVIMVGSAALIANLVFFMCQALPSAAALWVISALPLLSAAVSYCSPGDDEHGPERDDLIDIRSLPKGYFAKLICVVFVFALAAGVSKGIAAFTLPSEPFLGAKPSTWEVFISFLLVAAFMVATAVVLTFKNIDMSKIYIPVCFAMAAGMLLCPIFGRFLPAQGVLVGVMYNVFILVVWCLLIELAGRTTLGATRVFGFGRGASALATTAGWALASFAQRFVEDAASAYTVFFLIAAFALLAVMVLVLGEGTVSEALAKTMALEAGARADGREPHGAEAGGEAGDPWADACEAISAECKLTAREAEVFALLSKGRSISYIADELVLAPNTVKGYTKNVYAKAGIHSRQELIDMTESRMAETRKAAGR